MKPLDGVNVLDLSWVVAGPLMSRTLADFGADVIRVESPGRVDTARVMQPFHRGEFGIENSYLYQTCNAGKRGIAVDLSHSSGQAIIRDLVGWADVVLESFSPGTLAKWGLDYAALSSINPEIIMVSSSLMGQSGPLSQLAGYGNIGASVSGFQALVGASGQLPLGPYGPYTDYVAPRLGLVAILTGLIDKRTSGQGRHIDLSQVEAGIFFLSASIARTLAGCPPERARGNDDSVMFPHGVFACASEDGLDRFVAIAIRDEDDWLNLVNVMERSDWHSDLTLRDLDERRARADEINGAIDSWTSSRPIDVVEAALHQRGVPVYRAVSALDYPQDPQVRARGHLQTVTHPLNGTVVVEGPRVLLGETPGTVDKAAPCVGEHTRSVLADIAGYDDNEIARLYSEGVVA